MKRILLNSLFFCSFIFLYCCNDKGSGCGYIKLEHIGESNKPIPEIVFYINQCFDTTTIKYGDAFRISWNEFNSIKIAIEKNRFVSKEFGSLPLYKFSIFRDKEEVTFVAMDKDSTQQVFKSILNNLNSTKQKDSIKSSFENIIRRL
jgi:hypothetical protein